MAKGKRYNYEEYHKTIEGVLYKKCAYHEEFFDKEGWFPCTDEYFYKNKLNKSDGHYPECKQCSIRKSSKWQKENPELYKSNMKVFNANQTEKTKTYWREKAVRQRESGYCKEWARNNPDRLR